MQKNEAAQAAIRSIVEILISLEISKRKKNNEKYVFTWTYFFNASYPK